MGCPLERLRFFDGKRPPQRRDRICKLAAGREDASTHRVGREHGRRGLQCVGGPAEEARVIGPSLVEPVGSLRELHATVHILLGRARQERECFGAASKRAALRCLSAHEHEKRRRSLERTLVEVERAHDGAPRCVVVLEDLVVEAGDFGPETGLAGVEGLLLLGGEEEFNGLLSVAGLAGELSRLARGGRRLLWRSCLPNGLGGTQVLRLVAHGARLVFVTPRGFEFGLQIIPGGACELPFARFAEPDKLVGRSMEPERLIEAGFGDEDAAEEPARVGIPRLRKQRFAKVALCRTRLME